MYLSSHSAGPSHKRCRSPVDSVPLSTPVTGSLAPTHADLLPPRKRFRDSYSSEASMEEDAEVGPTEAEVDMELGIGDGDDVGDHVEIDLRDVRDDTEEYEADASAGDTAEVGVDPMTAPLVEEEIVEPAGEDSSDSSGTRDGIVRSVKDMPVDLDDVVRDFYHHMSEVRVDRIVGIETAQRRLEADQLIASGDRARMAEMIYSLRLENLKVRAMLDIERDRVSSLRLHMSLSQEEFRQIRRDRDDARGRLRRLESYLGRRFVNQNLELGNGNNNGNDNGNGNGNDNGNGNENDNGNGNGNDNGNGNGNHGGDNGDRNENHNVNGRGDSDCREMRIQKMENRSWDIVSSENNDIACYISQSYRETHRDSAPNGSTRREDRVEKFIGVFQITYKKCDCLQNLQEYKDCCFECQQLDGLTPALAAYAT
ncbi:hypothetical protein Tco_1143598 [Tanacetum coccineum]